MKIDVIESIIVEQLSTIERQLNRNKLHYTKETLLIVVEELIILRRE